MQIQSLSYNKSTSKEVSCKRGKETTFFLPIKKSPPLRSSVLNDEFKLRSCGLRVDADHRHNEIRALAGSPGLWTSLAR